MNPLLILLTAVLLVRTNSAQGYVSFDNLFVDAPIYMPDGTGPGAAGKAQLYLLTEAGYSPVGPIQGFLTSSPEATHYIVGTIVSIPGIPPGSLATLHIRAWVDAPSWESALLRGQSNDIDAMLMPEGEVPLYLHGLQSFSLIPEPSAIRMILIGAAALAFTHRKRKATL